MHRQSLDDAISTADLLADLQCPAEHAKPTVADLLTCTGHVATALTVCWVLHVLV